MCFLDLRTQGVKQGLLLLLAGLDLQVDTAKPDECIELSDPLLVNDCLQTVSVRADLLIDNLCSQKQVQGFLPLLDFNKIRGLHAFSVSLRLILRESIQALICGLDQSLATLENPIEPLAGMGFESEGVSRLIRVGLVELRLLLDAGLGFFLLGTGAFLVADGFFHVHGEGQSASHLNTKMCKNFAFC